MRFVVLGNGLLGWNLARVLEERRHPSVVLTRAEVDLVGNFAAPLRVALSPGDVLVNAAGLTNVDACEDRVEEAMRVNGEAPGIMARTAVERGARFVHVSSDAVLDVTNAYAESKVRGEAAVRGALGSDALIFRISTTFGPHPTRRDFVQWVLGMLGKGEPFTVLSDFVSSPGYAPDAARAIVALVAAGATGVQQFANHPGLSRYDLALAVQRAWGLPGTIRPGKMDEFKGFRARRPKEVRMASTVGPYYTPMELGACLADYRSAERSAPAVPARDGS